MFQRRSVKVRAPLRLVVFPVATHSLNPHYMCVCVCVCVVGDICIVTEGGRTRERGSSGRPNCAPQAEASVRASAMAEKSAAMWEQRLHAAEVAATRRVRAADKSVADMRDRMQHLEQQLKQVKAVAKGAGVGGTQQQPRPASTAGSKGGGTGDGDGARKLVLLTNQMEIMRAGTCSQRRATMSHGVRGMRLTRGVWRACATELRRYKRMAVDGGLMWSETSTEEGAEGARATRASRYHHLGPSASHAEAQRAPEKSVQEPCGS
jgi:hypothetical protein